MAVTVTEVSPFERRLTLRFEGIPLDKAETRAARRLSRQMDINGFRRGRAPRRMVENLVGKERIRQDAIEELLEERLPETLMDSGLVPAATPSVEGIRDVDQGVEVDVQVSLWPSLEEAPYYRGRQIELEDPGLDADEELIQKHLDRYREQFTEIETVARSSVEGDYVAIDLRASHGGHAVDALSVSDFLYEIGSESLLEDMGSHLAGSSAGDILRFTTQLRFDAEGLEAGTEIEAHVLVKEVKEKRLPDLDDEWVADFTEFETVEELRNSIAEEIEESRLKILRIGFQEKLISELVGEIDIDIPRAVIQATSVRLFERLQTRLDGYGMTFDEYMAASRNDQESFFANLQDEAAREITTKVMLDSVVADADLEVEEEELQQAYERSAEGLDQTGEEIAARLAGSVHELNLIGDILRAKAMTTLVRNAVATDSDGNVLDLQFEYTDGAEDEEDETEQGDQ